MIEGRRVSFEEEEIWFPYSLINEETGEELSSPFPVVVFTIDNMPMGVGRVVGMIGGAEEGTPVIEIDDQTAPNGVVQILGAECWWTPVNSDAELVDLTARDVEFNGISPYAYVKGLDDRLIAE